MEKLPYDIIEYILLFICRNSDSISICSVSKNLYQFGKMFGNMKILKIKKPLLIDNYHTIRKMIIYNDCIPQFPLSKEVEIFGFKGIVLTGRKEKTEILTIRVDEEFKGELYVNWDNFPILKKIYITADSVNRSGIERLKYLQEVHIKTLEGYFLKEEGKENIYFDENDTEFILKKLKKRKLTQRTLTQ